MEHCWSRHQSCQDRVVSYRYEVATPPEDFIARRAIFSSPAGPEDMRLAEAAFATILFVHWRCRKPILHAGSWQNMNTVKVLRQHKVQRDCGLLCVPARPVVKKEPIALDQS